MPDGFISLKDTLSFRSLRSRNGGLLTSGGIEVGVNFVRSNRRSHSSINHLFHAFIHLKKSVGETQKIIGL